MSSAHTPSLTLRDMYNIQLRALALKDSRSGNLVRLAVALGLALSIIDGNENSGVLGRVGTREADGLATGAGSGAGEVDLSAALGHPLIFSLLIPRRM